MFFYKCASIGDLIRRCHSIAQTRLSGRWYFRGQRDSRWTLAPSLLRADAAKHGITDPKEHEDRVVKYLTRVLNERSNIAQRIVNERGNLLAMAQHYGIRTRLLDWTRDPAIALYFASSDALRVPTEDGAYFSVFAMPEIYLNVGSAASKASFVKPVRAANPNLTAQRALHTLHEWEDSDLWDPTRAEETDDPVKNVSPSMATRLIRLDLPHQEASRTVHGLITDGLDASILFPTEHGFVRFAEDLARLDREHAARLDDPRLLVLRVDEDSE